MITQKQIKLITSLKQKKYRNEHGLFIVDGAKMVAELIEQKHPFSIHSIYGLEEWTTTNSALLEKQNLQYYTISSKELDRISPLQSPNQALALCHIPKTDQTNIPSNQLILALDHISDPGNLGTIIRIADWFGIDHIVCSNDTADCFNPKVIQATMGSFMRVQLHYTDLNQFLSTTSLSSFGTFLDGEDLYQKTLPKEGIIVIGNEGKGISAEIEKHISQKIKIPSFPHQETPNNAESLNAAVATAITIAEFKRQQKK